MIANRSIENDITLLIVDESDSQAPQTKRIKAEGKFQLTFFHRAPYRLYAFEEFDEELWGNPEPATLLAPKSVAFDVKEGQHSLASVPFILEEEFRDALNKTDF